jgi:WD40 repeat protein
VVVRELATGKEPLRLKDLPAAVTTIAFAPDGKELAVAGSDRRVRRYDPATGRTLGKLDCGGQEVKGAFLLGQKIMSTVSGSGHLRLWDRTTGKSLTPANRLRGWPRTSLEVVAFAPDARTVALGDGKQSIGLWDLRTGRRAFPVAAHEGGITSVSLTTDGTTLATYSFVDRTFRRWKVATGAELGRLKRTGEFPLCAALSGDGKLVAVGGNTWTRATGLRGTPCLVNAATGKVLHSLRGPTSMVRSLAFSPDNQTLAAGDGDGGVCLWATATGKPLHRLRGGKGGVRALAFSPDGKVLAAASNGPDDHTLRLWDPATGKLLHRIERGYCDTSSVAFSPDGRMAAVASGEQAVAVWEVATGGKRFPLPKQRGWCVRCVAFSPDGNLLAVGVDNAVCLWSLLTLTEVKRFSGHRGGVTSLAFTPDGRTLISGSGDTTALLWDVRALARAARPRSRKLKPGEADQLWLDLGGAAAARAYRALRLLASAPRQALPCLRKWLRPVEALDAARQKQALRWVGELDSGRYAVRRKASQRLEELGEAARSVLRTALSRRPSAEARRQLVRLLARFGGVSLRQARAVEVLERMGTAEARRLLAELARGEGWARLTQAARAAQTRAARFTPSVR